MRTQRGSQVTGTSFFPPFFLAYLLFACSGFNTTLLSVVATGLPASRTDASIGAIFAAQYLGQLLGPLATFGRPTGALISGLSLSAAAALCIASLHNLGPALLATYGFGLGQVMAATNLFVGLASAESERAARLERLNFFWPVSALCCPLVLRLVHPASATSPFLLVTLNSVPLIGALLLFRANHSVRETRTEPLNRSDGGAWYVLATMCVLAALACGIESALFSWAPLFSHRFGAGSYGMEKGTTFFWAGMIAGRLAASVYLAEYRARFLAGFAAFVCSAGIVMLAFSRGEAWMLLGFFLAGFALAPIYPAIIADSIPFRASSLIFTSAGVGGMVLPWVTGRLSDAHGSLRQGQLVSAVSCLLLGFVLVAQKLRRQKTPALA